MVFYEVSVGGRIYRIQMERADVSSGDAKDPSKTRAGEDHWSVLLDGREVSVSCVPFGPDALSLIVNGESFDVRRERAAEGRIFIRGRAYEYSLQDPRSLRRRGHRSTSIVVHRHRTLPQFSCPWALRRSRVHRRRRPS